MIRPRLVLALLATSAASAGAQALPFSFLDNAYTAKIIANSSSGSIGLAFLPDGTVLRDFGSNTLTRLDRNTTSSFHGDNLWAASTQFLSQGVGGYGMSYNPLDGYLYMNSPNGIKRVDPGTGTVSALSGSNAGYYYGLKVTSANKIVYNGSDNLVHMYNLNTNTDAAIYNSGTFNDDIAVDGAGNIFVAALSACRVDVLHADGSLNRQISVSDGSGCADGVTNGGGSIFANLTNGDIAKYSFSGADYTGTVTQTIIAGGKGCYGDFAGAGPDGAFYVNRACQQYTDGYTDGGYSLVRIEAVNPNDGFGDTAPEPATFVLMGTGLLGMAAFARKRRK